jgi:hypothetical protein
MNQKNLFLIKKYGNETNHAQIEKRVFWTTNPPANPLSFPNPSSFPDP